MNHEYWGEHVKSNWMDIAYFGSFVENEIDSNLHTESLADNRTLFTVFDSYFGKYKFDKNMGKALQSFHVRYLNQNPDHISFFSGNLLGTPVIRFKDSDLNRFFEIFPTVDYESLSRDIKSLPSINKDFKISSDTLNQTCFYFIHRFLTSNLLPPKDREVFAYNVAITFFYRTIAALMSDYFRYEANKSVALATFARLSNKHLIKQLGSWQKLIEYRAKELIKKDSIHRVSFENYNDDYKIVYAINDAQGRVRDAVKNYYVVFAEVIERGESITSASATVISPEGEETVKDKTEGVEKHLSYIHSIVGDQHTFIKDDLVGVITSINKNTSAKMVKSVLTWISENYIVAEHKKTIDDFIDKTYVYCVHLLDYGGTVIDRRDYSKRLIALKNMLLSTRSQDPELEVIRDLGKRIIKNSQKTSISTSLMLSTRTSIMLYLYLRTTVGKM
jgi:hypothetical protein